MKLSQAAQLAGGKIVGADLEFGGVSTDTRTLRAGDLFVALRGERFDAHDFLAAALAEGAAAAVVERDGEAFSSRVEVSNAREALGRIAAGWADQFPARRVAVTGNAGKTTVKEMVAAMLGDGVHATRGNLNNDVGVPLTLLELKAEHRYGVFELGANAPGEIAWTSSLVRPEVALITNVTGAHLEGFGSMQGIADAKAEIFTGMDRGAVAIINQEDHFADYFAARALANGLSLVRIGYGQDADVVASKIEEERTSVSFVLSADGGEWPVTVPLPGRHQVLNALMAFAMVRVLGVDASAALSRLAGLRPVKGRMNLVECLGGTLVDDTYNANPGSVRAAVDWLRLQRAPRALVLGGLAELGAASAGIHRELGEYARQAGLEALVTLPAAAEAQKGFDGSEPVGDAEEAAGRVADILRAGGTVLVKGSRSARMETVVDALEKMGEVV